MARKNNTKKPEQIAEQERKKKEFEIIIEEEKANIIAENPCQEEIFDSTNFDYVKDVWLNDFSDIKKISEREKIRKDKKKDEAKKKKSNNKARKSKKNKLIKKLKEDPELIKNFVRKYYNSYISRPSKRTVVVSNKETKTCQKTAPDPLMSSFIKMMNPELPQEQVDSMLTFHQQAMTLETFIGHVLEEYIFETAKKYEWANCWGECVSYVDFCKKDGTLLQVKNSTTSENSSSSQVRNGTPIIPWFRRNSSTGKTYWPKLNDILGIKEDEDALDEEKFVEFAKKIFENSMSIRINDSQHGGSDISNSN